MEYFAIKVLKKYNICTTILTTNGNNKIHTVTQFRKKKKKQIETACWKIINSDRSNAQYLH